MKAPPVFSFVDEQRRFLLLLIGFLTFLAVISVGIVLSMTTAIGRFSDNLEKTGIIMVMPGDSGDAAKKLMAANRPEILRATSVGRDEAGRLLKSWLKSADALNNYIPEITRVQTRTAAGLDKIAKEAAAQKIRFVGAAAATPDRSVGIRIILMAGFVFFTVLAALAACIIHSVKNIIKIHAREIGILNQIGSTNGYIAAQIQKAMIGVSARGAAAGLLAGWAMLLAINGLSRMSKVGLLANMGMTAPDWTITGMTAAAIIILIVFITQKTTMKILAK